MVDHSAQFIYILHPSHNGQRVFADVRFCNHSVVGEPVLARPKVDLLVKLRCTENLFARKPEIL